MDGLDPRSPIDMEEFVSYSRELQVVDATLGNSYAIYGNRIESRLNPDHKTMAKNCFSGLGLRGCKIRESFKEEAGHGWLMEESAGLQFLGNEESAGLEEYCLSCCSMTRATAQIDEVWDLTCDAGTTHQFTKISEQYYCMEFRFLRNEYLGDKTILYCRIEREGEIWDPPSWLDAAKTIPNPDYDKTTFYGDKCIEPELNRDDKSAFRGYTMELTVEEKNDGFTYWRMVHDCKITIDEELHIPMRNEDLWNPGGANLVYERIIMKSPDEFGPYSMPLQFIIMSTLFCFCCCCQGLKYGRDDPCRVCSRRLIFRRKKCFWCNFYKAVPAKDRIYKEWQKEDKARRDVEEPLTTEKMFTKFEHFLDGIRQQVKGTTRDEDQYEMERSDMDVGYRRRHPSKRAIVPSDLFERDTGITVVPKTLFDKFGKQGVYPSYSIGSPARDAYNNKTRFDMSYIPMARDAKIAGEIETPFKEGNHLAIGLTMDVTQPPSPESVDSVDENYLEDVDRYGIEEAARKKRKRDKKKRKKEQRGGAMLAIKSGTSSEPEGPKRLMFADEGVDGGGVRQIKFGVSVDDEGGGRSKFRPSATAKPVKSALKTGGLKKSLKYNTSMDVDGGSKQETNRGVGFAPPAEDTKIEDAEDDDDDDLDFDFEAMADAAAGKAAAKLGYVQTPEDRTREETEEEARLEAKIRAQQQRKAGERKKAGLKIEFSADKLLEHTKKERDAKKNAAGGAFARKAKSRWSQVANQINEDSKESYLMKLKAEPKNFLALQRLGVIVKKEADGEIARNPIYAFQLFRCAALTLEKSIEIRGVKEIENDQDFPWRDLAEAHLRTWLLQGIRGDRHHLDSSCLAWGHASRQLVNASDPRCLVHYASSQQFVGNYKTAAQILGEIIVNFPNYQKLNSVCFQACIILKSLHHYKQAAAYLEKVLSLGPPAPYTVVDIMFIMGRIYEEWSKEEDGHYEQTSHKAYMKVMMALKTEEILPSLTGFDDWLGDAVTWCSLAEKCEAGGHYVLAADFFNESIRRYEDEEHHTPLAQLWFELSKCFARSGKMKQAKQALERALQIEPENKKMVGVWTEWEDPKHLFETQLRLPPKKFAAKISELMPQA
ncbi:hypothetical protein TL16_g11400 [Triparma laevis f. inornata]|uniref:Uncharacterized protein n=1 Tax=Triparma laevis f. inornata TaxID=1714386 RepID=A0A9W7ESM3_9STRA|nr:hypothetical protein TL16_g11400 [Triparma laevis f. inornata]